MSTTLNDRTKLLKMYQSKVTLPARRSIECSCGEVESRQELKAKIEDLRAENTRLKADLEFHSNQGSPPVPPHRRKPSFSGLFEDLVGDDDTTADLSVQEIPASSFTERKPRSTQEIHDHDSLQVDLPGESIRPKAERAQPVSRFRSNPTARTYSFDLNDPTPKTNRKSKYFTPDVDEHELEDIMLDRSSISSLSKRSRTNPFTTTHEASEKRKTLPGKSHSPDTRSMSPSKRLAPQRDRIIPKRSGGTMELLGISDANGRPKKGVVIGARVYRK